MKTALVLLREFISKSGEFPHMISTSEWLEGIDLSIYIRRSWRYLEGERKHVLELANITSKSPGKGVFRNFLQGLESWKLYDGIYVENILTQRFFDFFIKSGYTSVEDKGARLPKSVYKLWRDK